MTKVIFAFLTLFLISACSTAPKFQINGVDKILTPTDVLVDFPIRKSSTVMWGGIIVNSENLKIGTLLEVLAYPLDSNYEPNIQKIPFGRFLTEHPEYLETVNYAAGRIITVVGPIIEVRKGVIGAAQYSYPVITAEQLHLWPTADQKSDTRFHFGVGVLFTN